MKKTILFSLLFVFTFSMALGITAFLTTDEASAQTVELCLWECRFETVVSTDWGDGVICPTGSYYVYRVSACLGGPFDCQDHKWIVGCKWPGAQFATPIFPPVQLY